MIAQLVKKKESGPRRVKREQVFMRRAAHLPVWMAAMAAARSQGST